MTSISAPPLGQAPARFDLLCKIAQGYAMPPFWILAPQQIISLLVIVFILMSASPCTAADSQTALHPSADATAAHLLYELVEDGSPTEALRIPVAEWYPRNGKPEGMVLAIHGLALHGGRYSLLGRFAASTGYYLAAPDLRGFGKCRFDKTGKYSTGEDRRNKINYDKSAEDVALLATWMKRKYPDLPLTILGESLGATMALKVAAAHPDLVSGIVLSSPAAKVNALMYVYPENVAQTVAGLIRPSSNVKLNAFMQKLVSFNPQVGAALLKDPLVAKELTVGELLVSDSFVHKTINYARQIKEGTPVLILAASKDHCVKPEAVTKITENIKSANQTIRWLDHHDHLLLESEFIRTATVDSLLDWSEDLSPERKQELAKMHQLLMDLGDRAAD